MLGGGIDGWKSGGKGICGFVLFLLISLGVECLGPGLVVVSNEPEGVLGVRSTGDDNHVLNCNL